MPSPLSVTAVIGAGLHPALLGSASTAGQIGPSQAQIRDLAHRIWEAEGRPTGRETEHWAEAEARLRALFAHIRMVRESAAW